MDALEEPRDWTDGGENLDYLFDQTYVSIVAGFRSQLATKQLDQQEQINVWLMLFNLKYDSDLTIYPQGMGEIRAYITGNSDITEADLDGCGFTLDNFQALVGSLSTDDKVTFKTVQVKLGNVDLGQTGDYILEVTTDDTSYTVGEPVSFTATLTDNEEVPVPDVNIAVFLVDPSDETVYFDQLVTNGSGQISGPSLRRCSRPATIRSRPRPTWAGEAVTLP